MQNLFIFSILVLNLSLASAQDKVAYSWVYETDPQTNKYVPTTLRLFDHAYSLNIKFMFSCIKNLSESKYGTLAAAENCKKQVSTENGRMTVKAISYNNSFNGDGSSRELKINILNRPAGFNKMIGCIAGRTKYKSPENDTTTIAECIKEIRLGKSPAELEVLYLNPEMAVKAAHNKNTNSVENLVQGIQKFVTRSYESWTGKVYNFNTSQYSREVYIYANCLKFNARRSQVFPNDDDVFKYCYKNLEDNINAPTNQPAFVFMDVNFESELYSWRMEYALHEIQLRHKDFSPLVLAVRIAYESEIAFDRFLVEDKARDSYD